MADPKPKMTNIICTIPGSGRLFTSVGALRAGETAKLPAAEARLYLERDNADKVNKRKSSPRIAKNAETGNDGGNGDNRAEQPPETPRNAQKDGIYGDGNDHPDEAPRGSSGDDS